MAQIGNSDDGRENNVELNLVPVIDLMSVMITFLLITAVWSQVSMLQLGQSIYGTTQEDQKPPPEEKKDDVVLRVDITAKGYQILNGLEKSLIKRLDDGSFDNKSLVLLLEKIKSVNPDKTNAIVTIQDELEYEYLIDGMDQLLAAGFPDVGITASGVD